MNKTMLKKREGKFQNGTSIVGLGTNPCRLGRGTMGISVEIFREKKKEKQDTNKLSVFFFFFLTVKLVILKNVFKEPWENVENLDFHRKMALKMKQLLIKQKQLFKTDK